jgi:hypothetical protein
MSAKSLIWLLRMNKLKTNTTFWLSANSKVYCFLLPYLPYTKRYAPLKDKANAQAKSANAHIAFLPRLTRKRRIEKLK